MSDFTLGSAYEYVTLVDRTGRGGCEIVHDGVRIVFPPGTASRTVPLFLAAWLFGVDKDRVHTLDGDFVRRFGLKDPPESVLTDLGPDVADCTPITPDLGRIERWNVDAFAPNRGATRAVAVARDPNDFANQGAPAGATFSRER